MTEEQKTKFVNVGLETCRKGVKVGAGLTLVALAGLGAFALTKDSMQAKEDAQKRIQSANNFYNKHKNIR